VFFRRYNEPSPFNTRALRARDGGWVGKEREEGGAGAGKVLFVFVDDLIRFTTEAQGG